jgi:pimeloyl-ACP methyl ester carboxylesterase
MRRYLVVRGMGLAASGRALPRGIAAGLAAISGWWVGNDAAGHEISRISAPTLIADGTDDQVAPVANDHILARLIPGVRLVLYPDAGHAFLFQDWTRFAALVESFLTGPSG